MVFLKKRNKNKIINDPLWRGGSDWFQFIPEPLPAQQQFVNKRDALLDEEDNEINVMEN